MVYFQHPRLQLLVKHDIESQQFKTTVRLFLLTRTVNVLQLGLHCEDSLDDDRFNFFPNFVCMLKGCWLAWFARWLRHHARKTLRNFQFVLLIVEVRVLFVERVIGQVHIHILHIVRTFVLLGGQPH